MVDMKNYKAFIFLSHNIAKNQLQLVYLEL